GRAPAHRGLRLVTAARAEAPRRVEDRRGPPLRRRARSVSPSAGDREIVSRAGAVACTFGRVVAPQALDGVLLAVVARDVVQAARNGRGRRDAEVVTDPRALVAVLVGRIVVPTAEVLAVDDVLGARIGHRLLD